MTADFPPILFLDIATTTGWCEGAPGARPESGTLRLCKTGGADAEAFGGLLRWLGDRLTARRYLRVVFEAPVGPGMDRAGVTNWKTKRRLIGLCAVAEAVAHSTGHPVFEASAMTIRKHVLGSGRPAEPKKAVMAAMRLSGFDPKDDNEADAIAGWIYACSVTERQSMPLLRGAQ